MKVFDDGQDRTTHTKVPRRQKKLGDCSCSQAYMYYACLYCSYVLVLI